MAVPRMASPQPFYLLDPESLTLPPEEVAEKKGADDIPETEHDFSVDYIVTPDTVIRCPNRRRPRGLVWDDLTSEKIAAIPVLAQRRPT